MRGHIVTQPKPNPFELFAQSETNLKALYSFGKLFEFKKLLEQSFERRVSFDQLGEIVNMIVRNPPVDEMVAETIRIFAEVL